MSDLAITAIPATIARLGRPRLKEVGGTSALLALLEEHSIPTLMEEGRVATASDLAAACVVIRHLVALWRRQEAEKHDLARESRLLRQDLDTLSRDGRYR
ncbi:MAG: hypothetical protein ABFE16_10030 [Armatimonadia bacterium]